MLLALGMCMGVFSTTVFAYSDESATTTTTEKAETVETVPDKTEDKTSEEVPYTVTVNEDGTVVFSFNGKEWTYGAEEKPKSTNMLPAIFTLIVLACGGGFFVFKKVQEKKKEQEAAKPDPDADYVDDDEGYEYDPEFEDDDVDFIADDEDNEPV